MNLSKEMRIIMVIKTSKELLGEIKKYMYMNGFNNESIAKKRHITKQSVSSFFKTENPRIDSILETIAAMNCELHIEIKNKDEN